MVIQERANQGYEKEEQSWSVKVMDGTIASPGMQKFQTQGTGAGRQESEAYSLTKRTVFRTNRRVLHTVQQWALLRVSHACVFTSTGL